MRVAGKRQRVRASEDVEEDEARAGMEPPSEPQEERISEEEPPLVPKEKISEALEQAVERAVAAPAPEVQSDAAAAAKSKTAKERPERPLRATGAIGEIHREEERALRDWIAQFGTEGAFKIQVNRVQPEYVRIAGKEVLTAGFVKTYEKPIDEEFLQRTHGGGTYALKVTLRREDGSYGYTKGMHRTVTIAGEPNVDHLINTPPGQPAPHAPSESPSLVKETFQYMRDRDAARASEDARRANSDDISPAIQMMIAGLREDSAILRRELADARRETLEARNAKAPEDPIKDKILSNLLDGNSGQVEALRLRYEAELRQTKELAAAEIQRERDRAVALEQRLTDRAERDREEVRRGYERELGALRQSHDVALASARATADVQLSVTKGEVARLQRENDGLREDVKDLRAKKEKTLVEQAKEIQSVRDALGGSEDGEKSTFDKMLELASSPMAGEVVQRVMGGGAAAAPPAPPPGMMQAQAVPRRPQIVRSRSTGQRFVMSPTGQLREVVKKPATAVPAVVTAEGEVVTPAILMPEADPVQIAQLITLLEGAFTSQQEPEVVAQGGRTNAPALVQWIVEHHTEQTAGVDLFLSKVAKLPGTSPLATQAGRNWIRKVGKALVGG